MKKLVCTSILVTGALLLTGATSASAQIPDDEPPAEVGADVETPVRVCPIAIALGGDVSSDCPPPAATPDAEIDADGEVPDDVGAEVDAPVNVCPVTVSLGSDVDTDCPPPVDVEGIVEALFPWLPADDAPAEVGADVEAPVRICPITVVLAGEPDADCPS